MAKYKILGKPGYVETVVKIIATDLLSSAPTLELGLLVYDMNYETEFLLTQQCLTQTVKVQSGKAVATFRLKLPPGIYTFGVKNVVGRTKKIAVRDISACG